MIYELRKYIANEGKEEALAKRFQDSTLNIFDRLGIKVDRFWRHKDDPRLLYYVCVWDSEEQMKSVWDEFRNDAEWKRAKAETEKDGPLNQAIESTVMIKFSI